MSGSRFTARLRWQILPDDLDVVVESKAVESDEGEGLGIAACIELDEADTCACAELNGEPSVRAEVE